MIQRDAALPSKHQVQPIPTHNEEFSHASFAHNRGSSHWRRISRACPGRTEELCRAKGYIDVQQLTCAQLAGTFQEDADFLGVWYSGWYNGLAKKHAINVSRTKEGIHNVIVYCKANPTKKVIQAIDVILKAEKN